MNLQKLFKPYIVRRENGQCQILIPLIELDNFCNKLQKFTNETTYPGDKLMQANFKITELKTEILELKKHYKIALKKIKKLLDKG